MNSSGASQTTKKADGAQESSDLGDSVMVQHWRAAGMTYLKYSNICADLVRRVLKDSAKQQMKKSGGEYSMQRAEWEAGKIVKRCTSMQCFDFVSIVPFHR